MVIYNCTFMMLREKEGEFLDWFRAGAGVLTAPEGSGGEAVSVLFSRNPRLSALVSAGGIYSDEADAHSVAFQVEFADEAQGAEMGRCASRHVVCAICREIRSRGHDFLPRYSDALTCNGEW